MIAPTANVLQEYPYGSQTVRVIQCTCGKVIKSKRDRHVKCRGCKITMRLPGFVDHRERDPNQFVDVPAPVVEPVPEPKKKARKRPGKKTPVKAAASTTGRKRKSKA